MNCPLTSEIWQRYQETGDSRVANHLASCAACREEAGQFARLQHTLSTLPAHDAPAAVAARLQCLDADTREQAMTCKEVRAVLEAWLDGALEPAKSFLVEDHLLWCQPCAVEVTRAEALLVTLRDLPQLTAPDAIAERLEQARVPWWQRFFPTPAPVWSRQFALAAGLAGLVLVLLSSTLVMQIAHKPTLPTVANMTIQPNITNIAPNKSADAGPTEEATEPTAPQQRSTVQQHHPRHPVIVPADETDTEPAVVIPDSPMAIKPPPSIPDSFGPKAPPPVQQPVTVDKNFATGHTVKYEARETIVAAAINADRDAALTSNDNMAMRDQF